MADGRDEKVWTYHAKEHTEIKDAHVVTEDIPLRLWLKEVNPKGKCVDYGCGSGLWKNLFKGYEYYGVDQNQAMIQAAIARWPKDANRFSVVQWNAPDLADGSVDLIFTSAVIQHNLHPQKDLVVKQFHRMLKPGGHYLCTETTFRPDNYHHAFPSRPPFNDNLDDGYSFTKAGWVKYMAKHGFELVHYSGQSEYLWKKV